MTPQSSDRSAAIRTSDWLNRLAGALGDEYAERTPWSLTQDAAAIIRERQKECGLDWRRDGDVFIHASATVEEEAVLKGPIIIGRNCFVGAFAYLRGGVFLDDDCVIGPSCEVKSSFLLRGAKIAHLAFVGDSLLGEDVNIEAGVVIANHRNEQADKRILIGRPGGEIIDTGVEKFGALLGDGVKIGANAVIAPGAIIDPTTVISRGAVYDCHPDTDGASKGV